MTSLTDNLDEILARATAAVEAREAAAPLAGYRPDDDARSRRARAMSAAGWEAKPLRIASGADYDEGRAAGYLAALRTLDDGSTGGVVVLSGNPGSGKTAAAARWALTRPGVARSQRFTVARFLRAAEFFRSSRYQRGEGDPTTATRDEILRYPALVLDDVGAEYADANGSYRVDFDELVDRYYADDRTLVITTNLLYSSPAARAALKSRGEKVDDEAPTFAERYGDRVADRIRECGRWVGSAAASMRAPGGRR